MKHINKRLVFHFYISPEGVDTYTNRIHFACLSLLQNIFDEALFVIAIDDLSNTDAIKTLEKKLISLNIASNIEFKIKENNFLRDAGTFYDEIALHLGEYDGLTFFAHNKGTTNINMEHPETKRKTELWIMSLYFGNFYDIADMEEQLTEGRKLAYGTLLNEVTDRDRFLTIPMFTMGKECYFYAGTFFWLNERTMKQYIDRKGEKFVPIADRWYAENFFADNFPIQFCASYGLLHIQDFYITESEITDFTNFIYQDILDEYNDYCKLIYDRI